MKKILFTIFIINISLFGIAQDFDAKKPGKTQNLKKRKKELAKNEADVHILISGIQIIPEEHPYEKWSNIGRDRERLLKSIAGIKNPILISGDRHLAEISRLMVNDQEIIEITSSGLTHAYTSFSEEANKYRIGDVFADINFGLIQIEKSRENISWTGQILDDSGGLKLSITQ